MVACETNFFGTNINRILVQNFASENIKHFAMC